VGQFQVLRRAPVAVREQVLFGGLDEYRHRPGLQRLVRLVQVGGDGGARLAEVAQQLGRPLVQHGPLGAGDHFEDGVAGGRVREAALPQQSGGGQHAQGSLDGRRPRARVHVGQARDPLGGAQLAQHRQCLGDP
jgi:hypothetical protein